MYLIYLDESGTPPATDPDPYYSIGGLVVCERDWRRIDAEVETLKNNYHLNEIHTRRMYNRNKKSIHNFMTTGQPSRSAKMISDVYGLIAGSNLLLFCMTVDKVKEYRVNPSPDVEFTAWELLVERLNIGIDVLRKQTGVDEFGLIIMDEKNAPKDLRIRNYLNLLRRTGTRFQNIDRIIEDPVFTPSHWRNLTQLADAVVTCSKFYIKKEPFFMTQFAIIQDKFSKGHSGDIFGAGFKVW